MEENQSRVLEIRVNYDQALTALAKYKQSLDASKEAEKTLQKTIKERGYATDAESKALEANRVAMQEYNKKIQETRSAILLTRKAEQEQAGSLNQLRAQLSSATKQYDNLSRTMRESAQGQQLLDTIHKLREELKGGEEETGRFQRSVGDYENAIKRAIGSTNPFVSSLINVADTSGGAASTMGSLKSGVLSLGTALKTLAVNPIFLIISAVAGILMAIKKGIESNEETLARFNAVLAPFQRALDFALKIVQEAAGYFLTLAENVAKAASWFGSLLEKLPFVGDKIAEINKENEKAIALEQARYNLAKMSRDAVVSNAKDELEISKLRSQAMDKERYSAEERLAMIQRANELEEQRSKRNKEIAQEELRIAEEEAARAGNTAETNDKLAELRARVYQAEKEYFDKTRELAEKENSFKAEIASENKKRNEERIKQEGAARAAVEESIKKEEQAYKEAQEALFDLIEEGVDKRREEIKRETEERIREIEIRLETEENLTIAAREHLSTLIAALKEKEAQSLAAIDAEEVQRQADERAKELEFRLKYIQEGSAQELALKKQQLEAERLQAVEEAEKMGADVSAVNAYYADKEAQLEEDAINRKRDLVAEEIKIKSEVANAIGGVLTSLSALMEEVAGEDEELAKASKIVALAEIAIQQGVAIAKGIAEATAVPFPGNIAAIATTVATVVAGMTSAIKTVKSAKFSEGGLVVGEGSGTSDSIHASLSNGESVNTARSTSMFAPIYSILNQMGGGRPIVVHSPQQQQIGSDILAEAFARGASMLPAPVVSVQEITNVERRVRTIENNALI